MPEIKLKARENGPWLLPGPAECLMAEAQMTLAGEVVYLCRCGASSKKPFCDGTHLQIEFEAPEAELILKS
jgi:3-phenylpropionate/trans-cinnamate dioxygenase ferredoxin subunit